MSKKPRRVRAQPSAAVLPYGCGLPLAGTLPAGGGRKSNRFSGGVYVGKTLCAERASQAPPGAEAQAQRGPFGGKGVSLFRQSQRRPGFSRAALMCSLRIWGGQPRSLPSRAAKPNRTAAAIFSRSASSSAASYRARSSRRKSPRRLSSPARSQMSRDTRV